MVLKEQANACKFVLFIQPFAAVEHFTFYKTHFLSGKNAHYRIMSHYLSCCNTTTESIDIIHFHETIMCDV